MSEDSSALRDMLNARGAGHLPGHLGVVIETATTEEVAGFLDVRQELMAPNGFLHAASVIGLVDTLCGYSTVANLPEGASGFTTIELKANYLGTARDGRLRGVATPVHRGRTTHVWDARAFRDSDGKTVALFRCTQMILWPKAGEVSAA
jgi:uncharacterized protein (TIGR00369 family)